MMISPEAYVDNIKDKSYKNLLKERDKLIQNLKIFEKHYKNIDEPTTYPSFEIIYLYNLDYLIEIWKLVKEKYQDEFE